MLTEDNTNNVYGIYAKLLLFTFGDLFCFSQNGAPFKILCCFYPDTVKKLSDKINFD